MVPRSVRWRGIFSARHRHFAQAPSPVLYLPGHFRDFLFTYDTSGQDAHLRIAVQQQWQGRLELRRIEKLQAEQAVELLRRPVFQEQTLECGDSVGLIANGADRMSFGGFDVGNATRNSEPTGSLENVEVIGRDRLREHRTRHAENEPD